MSLSPYTVVIGTKEDSPYNVIPNAPIEIRKRSDGLLATIYSDEAGTTPITQPGATADDRGTFIFYAAADGYNALYNGITQPIDTGITSQVFSQAARVVPFDTLDQAINETNPLKMFEGAALNIKERRAGNGGGAIWDVVLTYSITPNLQNRLQSIVLPALSIVLREKTPSPKQLGAKLTGLPADFSNDVAVLDVLFSEYSESLLDAGIYPYYKVTSSNIIINSNKDAVWTVPNGTVSPADTTAPAALEIQGQNVTIVGDITCEGNRAGNTPNSIQIGAREGLFVVGGASSTAPAGNNFIHQGRLVLNNPYAVGIFTGHGDSAGDEVTGLRLDKLIVNKAEGYSTNFWALIDWSVNYIETSVENAGDDARVRTGNGSFPTALCYKGNIGRINARSAVVFEESTDEMQCGDITCTTFKTEDNQRCSAGNVYCTGVPVGTSQTFGFAVVTATDFTCGNVTVIGHASDVVAEPAISITDARRCTIDNILVRGTLSDSLDMRIRAREDLSIGSITLVNPVGNGGGLLIQDGFSPNDRTSIGRIISKGHATNDIQIDNSQPNLTIGSINPDAVFEANSEVALSLPDGVESKALIEIDSGTGAATISNSYNLGSVIENQPGIYRVLYDHRTFGRNFKVLTEGSNNLMVSVDNANSPTTEARLLFRDNSNALVRPRGFFFELKR